MPIGAGMGGCPAREGLRQAVLGGRQALVQIAGEGRGTLHFVGVVGQVARTFVLGGFEAHMLGERQFQRHTEYLLRLGFLQILAVETGDRLNMGGHHCPNLAVAACFRMCLQRSGFSWGRLPSDEVFSGIHVGLTACRSFRKRRPGHRR